MRDKERLGERVASVEADVENLKEDMDHVKTRLSVVENVVSEIKGRMNPFFDKYEKRSNRERYAVWTALIAAVSAIIVELLRCFF